MEIFIVLPLIILAFFFIVKNVFYSAKVNLFKDQAAWSGKDIKIKYAKAKGTTVSKNNDNYLKIIAEESKFFLEDQFNQEPE